MAGKRAGRTCTVCGNSQRQAIEHAIVDGVKSKRAIGAEFGIGRTALAHHVAKHMTAGLKKTIVKHAELVEETRDLDVMAALGRSAQKLERFLEAADAWLRDPNDPSRYNLGPRDHEVIVIWEREIDIGDGVRCVTERKKEPLADILRRCGEKSDMAPKPGEIRTVEVKHGDPRKLLLDAMTAGKPLFELIGKATGQIRPDPPAMTLNVFLGSPDWRRLEDALLAALKPYPPALEAAGQALATIAGEDDAR